MWIRSQRRNTLVNINFMRVINDGDYCLICGATTDGCDCELGVYSTEEKALKVLNRIEELIENQLRNSKRNGSDKLRLMYKSKLNQSLNEQRMNY